MPRTSKVNQLTADGRAERSLRIWKLRVAGMSMPAIAEKEGISVTLVAKDIARVLAQVQRDTREEAEEYRRVMIEVLQNLQLALYPSSMRGDLAATDRLLRVLDRLARLHGLEVPTEQTIVAVETRPDYVIDITPPTILDIRPSLPKREGTDSDQAVQ